MSPSLTRKRNHTDRDDLRTKKVQFRNLNWTLLLRDALSFAGGFCSGNGFFGEFFGFHLLFNIKEAGALIKKAVQETSGPGNDLVAVGGYHVHDADDCCNNG